jgi:K+-transporting ATPase A subunit
MRKLWLIALPYAVLLTLFMAPAADAENDGRGFYGATGDKAITNIMFGVILFFPLFVLLMSLLQGKLDRRKQARKAAEKQLQTAPWRGGW